MNIYPKYTILVEARQEVLFLLAEARNSSLERVVFI